MTDISVREMGWGPWKRQWYSICSAHRGYRRGCPECNGGRWVNVWGKRWNAFLFRSSPRLWRYWFNRRMESKDARAYQDV